MELPEMQPVSSSNIDSVGYDESSEILYIRFLNGSLYIYKNVSLLVYEQLLSAPSLGSYMHRNIKGAYAYERIE
ncbi:MAG: KTSC domain-containing protein [Bacteroidetes bacterium]|nr:KTSC domain-containing protein [Bacteroidota bacterium]